MGKEKSVPVKKRTSVYNRALPDKKSAKAAPSKRGKPSTLSKSKSPAPELLKKTKKELIRERNAARECLDIAGVILVGINAKEEVILINKKGCEILGYEKDEIIGRNWFDTFIPSEIRDNVRDSFKKLMSAETEPVRFFENTVLTSNGTERIIAWENTVIRDEGGDIISTLSSGEDITARKAAEDILINTLEETQQRQTEISALLEGSHAVMKYHDFSSAAQSIFNSCKHLIGATSGYVALLSKDGTENEVVFLDSGRLSCRVDPRLPMPIRGLRAEPYNSKEAVYHNDFLNSEWMKFMPEGHTKLRNVLFAPMIVKGKAVGLLGLGNKPKGFNENDANIATAFAELAVIALTQKKAEQLLRESREDLKRAQAVAQTGSWRLNVQQNELLWSEENWRIFGIAEGTPLTYETFLSTVHPDDREYVDRKWMAALRGEYYDIEHRIIVGDAIRWVRERAQLEFDKEGMLLGGFGTTQDITDKKHAEESLREAKEALEKANDELEGKIQYRTEELRKAYKVVQTEQQRLYSVLENIPAYVCLLTADYTFSYINRDFRKRFGDPGDRRCHDYLFDLREPCEGCQTFRIFTERLNMNQWQWTGPDGKTYAIYDYPFTDIDGTPLILEMGLDITDRKMAEEELQESREKLRNLFAHVQSLIEEERAHIAREIHDEFGTILTALKIDLSWLEKKFTGEQESLKTRTRKSLDLINSAIKTVQRISSQLRPGILDHLGLGAAIESELKEFGNRTGIVWDLCIDTGERSPDRDLSTTVFRIFQETLTNIARHAEATGISVSLTEKDNRLILLVKDNGKGITEEDLINPRAYGLMGMRERVQSFNGNIMITGTENKGTNVTVNIPLDDKERVK